MAHQYSVEIHDYLSAKLKSAQESLEVAQNKNSIPDVPFIEGQLEALNRVRKLMTDRFDLSNRKYFHG